MRDYAALSRIDIERVLAKDTAGKPPPHELEAERAVISAILLEGGKVLSLVRDELDDEGLDFYSDGHKNIYKAAIRLFLADSAVDIVTIAAAMRMDGTLKAVGGPSYLAEICDSTPAVANVTAHAQLVRVYSVARKTLAEAHIIRAELYGGDVAMSQYLQDIPARFERIVGGLEPRSIVSIGEVLRNEHTEIQRGANDGAQLAPLRTGLSHFDELSTGLHGGEWMLVGAETSVGKSTFAMTAAHNVAHDGAGGVLIFSTESGMTAKVYANRMACMRAGLSSERFRGGKANDEEKARLTIAKQEIVDLPIYFEPRRGSMSIAQMQAKTLRAQQWMARHGLELRLVVLDLISGLDARGEQLPRGANDEQKLRYIAERIDALLSMEEMRNVSLIATTQIDEKEEYPKGCKALRETAPSYVIIRRKQKPSKDDIERGREPAELELWKNRHGTRGVVAYQYFYKNGAYFGD